jgi:hypothetical protein
MVLTLIQTQTFASTNANECDEYRMAISKYLVQSSVEILNFLYMPVGW